MTTSAKWPLTISSTHMFDNTIKPLPRDDYKQIINFPSNSTIRFPSGLIIKSETLESILVDLIKAKHPKELV